jgi:hypothetical protein
MRQTRRCCAGQAPPRVATALHRLWPVAGGAARDGAPGAVRLAAVIRSRPTKRQSRTVMELEFHQLDLRYERLRMRQPAREQRLLASLADAGQQIPIVVVMAGAIYVARLRQSPTGTDQHLL